MIEKIYKNLKTTNKREIAKAITLIESSLPEDRKEAIALLTQVKAGDKQNSIRIGISGIPGVGKSTFIEALGSLVLKNEPDLKIAIMTIDPSSPLEGGSILADRLRMTSLSNHPNVFIRPTPTGTNHGGLSRRTRESMLLLEATGFDLIFVETVGVGQTEFHVASLVDIFLLLQMPSTGDEWQAMKKGILELADMIVINKADGDLLKAASRLEKILKLSFGTKELSPSILSCSALSQKGIEEVWDEIKKKVEDRKSKNLFYEKRIEQNLFWFENDLLDSFKEEVYSNKTIIKILDSFRKDLRDNKKTLSSLLAEDAVKSLLREDLLP